MIPMAHQNIRGEGLWKRRTIIKRLLTVFGEQRASIIRQTDPKIALDGFRQGSAKRGKPIVSAQSPGCGLRHCWVT